MVDAEGLLSTKAKEWRETQMGTYPQLDIILEYISDEEIAKILEDIESKKFGHRIIRQGAESYEEYCKRVLDLYLSNLGNIKDPEFYFSENNSDHSVGPTCEEKNESMIQFLCHTYAFNLARLHLQYHDPVDFEKSSEFMNELADCLKTVV